MAKRVVSSQQSCSKDGFVLDQEDVSSCLNSDGFSSTK